MILVPLLKPEVRDRIRRTVCANFGFGALVLSSRRGDRLEAELQPALNLFGDCLEILCRRYRAAIAIAADYLTSRRLAATRNSPQQRANRFEIPLRRLRDQRRAAGVAACRRSCLYRAAGVRFARSPHSQPREDCPQGRADRRDLQGRIVSEATHASDELPSGHEYR